MTLTGALQLTGIRFNHPFFARIIRESRRKLFDRNKTSKGEKVACIIIMLNYQGCVAIRAFNLSEQCQTIFQCIDHIVLVSDFNLQSHKFYLKEDPAHLKI